MPDQDTDAPESAAAPLDRTRKLFFIHVPKTAGSTINALLRRTGLPGAAHCEGRLTRASRDAFHDRYAWISGHVSITRAQNVLEDRIAGWTLYSAMRRPADQVRSHLNWQVEAFNKGPEFFYTHPVVNQKIIIDVMAADRTCRFQLMNLLLRYDGVFLNCQARFLAPELFEDPRPETARRALERYAYVGSSGDVGALWRRVSGALGAQAEAPPLHENRSPAWIDPHVFAHPDMREMLARHNRLDEMLYAVAAETFGWAP